MSSQPFRGGTVDVVIVGAGPAGLSAAVNAKARNLSAVVIDAREPVAKVRNYPEVTNYLGYPKAGGGELANHFAQHFAKTGFPFHKERAQKIMDQGDILMVGTDKEVYDGKTVILTFGVAQTKLLPGEEQYLGKGVSYCVTCDGALFSGKDVVVVGYVPEGEEEANALAGFARSVTYVATYENVETLDAAVKLIHAKPTAILGSTKVTGLKTDLGDMCADGVFVVREAMPVTSMLEGLAVEDGFVQVNRSMATNIPGVFAAGDCTGAPFQIAKAVGEGQVAALSAARYVYKQRKKEA
jgi:thioredoxin reductase (NADPH)